MAVSITRIPPEVGDSYTTSVDVARTLTVSSGTACKAAVHTASSSLRKTRTTGVASPASASGPLMAARRGHAAAGFGVNPTSS
jgi:hypothetical protein